MKKISKSWLIWLGIGFIFGLFLSISHYYLKPMCSTNDNFCFPSKIVEFLSYFPTVYLMLSNALDFVSKNTFLSIMYFIIPILQYLMIGSIIGLIMKKINNE